MSLIYLIFLSSYCHFLACTTISHLKQHFVRGSNNSEDLFIFRNSSASMLRVTYLISSHRTTVDHYSHLYLAYSTLLSKSPSTVPFKTSGSILFDTITFPHLVHYSLPTSLTISYSEPFTALARQHTQHRTIPFFL